MNGDTINQRLGKYKYVFNQQEADWIVRQLRKFGFFYVEQYRQSKLWRAKKEEMRAKLEYKCQGCNSDKKLQLHHLTYENLCEEPTQDLVWLCQSCHFSSHDFTAKVDREAYKNLIALAEPEDCVFITVTKDMLDKIDYKTSALGYHTWQEKWAFVDHLLDCSRQFSVLFRKR